jgi:hypothetical protein
MFFFLSLLFTFYKIREQKSLNRSCPRGRADTNGSGVVMGKGGKRIKIGVHMYVNAKMIPVEMISGIGRGGG